MVWLTAGPCPQYFHRRVGVRMSLQFSLFMFMASNFSTSWQLWGGQKIYALCDVTKGLFSVLCVLAHTCKQWSTLTELRHIVVRKHKVTFKSLALFKINILYIVFCRDIRWALLLGLIHITPPVHRFTSGSDTDGPCWHFYLLLVLFQRGPVESLISGLSRVLPWSVQLLPSSFYIFSNVVT